jgi:hypothetical protein
MVHSWRERKGSEAERQRVREPSADFSFVEMTRECFHEKASAATLRQAQGDTCAARAVGRSLLIAGMTKTMK